MQKQTVSHYSYICVFFYSLVMLCFGLKCMPTSVLWFSQEEAFVCILSSHRSIFLQCVTSTLESFSFSPWDAVGKVKMFLKYCKAVRDACVLSVHWTCEGQMSLNEFNFSCVRLVDWTKWLISVHLVSWNIHCWVFLIPSNMQAQASDEFFMKWCVMLTFWHHLSSDARHLNFFFLFVTALMEKRKEGRKQGNKKVRKQKNVSMLSAVFWSTRKSRCTNVKIHCFVWTSGDAFRISWWL